MENRPVPPGGAKQTGKASGREPVGTDWRAVLHRHADALWGGEPTDPEAAAALARTLGFVPSGRFGEQDLGWHGAPDESLTLQELAVRIEHRLGRKPLVIGDSAREVRRIAWCTGAAQGYIEDAARLSVDAYVSGEISEQTVHFARESGLGYIAAGHHATERYGVQALGAHLAAHFGLAHDFIDIDNPV